MVKKVLIAGCGSVGSLLGQILVTRGHRVWGLRRDPSKLPRKLMPVEADLADRPALSRLPGPFNLVFYTASADGRNPDAYRAAYVDGARNLLSALAEERYPERIFFTSSTAVYGQDDGSWVDEDSPAEPSQFSGQILLEGERLLQESPMPSTIVRLAGIYGPGRTRLISKVLADRSTCKEGFSNRIHVQDCARALHHLSQISDPQEIYLGVDCEPVDRCQLMGWLARKLGRPEPVPETSPAAGSRNNKRCSNRRLLSTGFKYSYPSFREGYSELLEGLEDEGEN